MAILEIIFWINIFIIVWAMIGYPVFLKILDIVFKIPDNPVDNKLEPTVTVMIVAHNEEKVITEKLNNFLQLDYPKEKLSCIIASDFCTDSTNMIVEEFIKQHKDRDIRIHKSEKHLGKTNAQNETQKYITSDIIVMTDANSMFKPDAIRKLVSSFTDSSIAYVAGQLKYRNVNNGTTSSNEGFYWKLDLKCRNIESKIQTITAGNGSIYAVRNKDYVDVTPIESHDTAFPFIYGLAGKRAIYNSAAIAYEKAGEVIEDEFKRKVRMNRKILHLMLPDIRVLNIFKYHWLSVFYFGHRTCRYLLWFAHTMVLLTNVLLAFMNGGFWNIVLILQLGFYLLALIGLSSSINNRLVKIINYYVMTIIAQWKGVINEMTGKSKPTWNKAESTR